MISRYSESRLARAADRPATSRGARAAKRSIGRLGNLRIYAVDGTAVRNRVDVDFTCGGTGARYAYIPMGEVWIDDALMGSGTDASATLLHEVVERTLMLRGMTYDKAHDRANERERTFRAQHPRLGALDVKLVGRAL